MGYTRIRMIFQLGSATNVINAFGTVGAPLAIRSYLNEILVFKHIQC